MNIVKNKIGWTAEQYRPYVYDLEQELKRQQNRAREHRRNIRAMQKKLDHRNTLASIVELQREYKRLLERTVPYLPTLQIDPIPFTPSPWVTTPVSPNAWPGSTISCGGGPSTVSEPAGK